jgi:hypothetical protein
VPGAAPKPANGSTPMQRQTHHTGARGSCVFNANPLRPAEAGLQHP